MKLTFIEIKFWKYIRITFIYVIDVLELWSSCTHPTQVKRVICRTHSRESIPDHLDCLIQNHEINFLFFCLFSSPSFFFFGLVMERGKSAQIHWKGSMLTRPLWTSKSWIFMKYFFTEIFCTKHQISTCWQKNKKTYPRKLKMTCFSSLPDLLVELFTWIPVSLNSDRRHWIMSYKITSLDLKIL